MLSATALVLPLVGAVVPGVRDFGRETNNGLTSDAAKQRFETVGPNEIPERRESATRRFLRKFWGLTPAMLGLTALLTWVLGNLLDTYVVLALLFFNAALGFLQEQSAAEAVAYLRQRLRATARARRDGVWSTVPARELVPDDLVRIRTGDFVPADLRLCEGSVDVDRSALTGESIQVEKASGEAVVSGSTVTRGEATALAFSVATAFVVNDFLKVQLVRKLVPWA